MQSLFLSLNSLYRVLYLPSLSFYLDYVSKICNVYLLSYLTFWMVSNYADSYWFLYSNKKVIYELRYL